jgi:hypothetical protein
MSDTFKAEVFVPKQNTIRIRVVSDGYEGYIEEMPTMRAFGKTEAEAWANTVMLVLKDMPTRMRVARPPSP